MSSVLIVAPVIVASWPAIAHAVTAAVATLGFSVLPSAEERRAVVKERSEIDVPDSEVLAESLTGEEEIVLAKGNISARVYRDARGTLKLCVDGNLSKSQLREIGEELLGAITQQYVYHRVRSELQERGMDVLSEEVTADRAVKIRVRAW